MEQAREAGRGERRVVGARFLTSLARRESDSVTVWS